MPINPHNTQPAAQAWADQFAAEVQDRGQLLFEEAIHRRGLCTEMFDEQLVALVDCAMECGSVAMGIALEENGRLKEVEH